MFQGSHNSLMAARGKPQLNTCFFEILIYTLYILTSRFLSNSKPKNAHSMGKKQACFTLKLFQQLFFNASNLRKLAFVLYHLKSCFPTVFISNIFLRTKILKCTDLFKILVHFFHKRKTPFLSDVLAKLKELFRIRFQSAAYRVCVDQS